MVVFFTKRGDQDQKNYLLRKTLAKTPEMDDLALKLFQAAILQLLLDPFHTEIISPGG